ncbi:MAG: hypothetical protein HDQ87_11865 [Clostridia bacterium]|nr:hypothetical protein [Clostridia bacterium]
MSSTEEGRAASSLMSGRLQKVFLSGVGSRNCIIRVPDRACGPEDGASAYYVNQLGPLPRALAAAVPSCALWTGPSSEPVQVPLDAVPLPQRTFCADLIIRRSASGGREYSCPAWPEMAGNAVGPAVLALTGDCPELSWLVETELMCSAGFAADIPSDVARRLQPGHSVRLASCQLILTSVSFGLSPHGLMQAVTPFESAPSGPDRRLFADTRDRRSVMRAALTAVRAMGSLGGQQTHEKVRAVHDWLCTNVRYADMSGERYRLNWRGYQTAWSSLGGRVTVCTGFARSFKLLCGLLGIPSIVAAGFAADGPHVWNYVRIGSRWYGVDCTWDAKRSGVIHDYFLKGRSFLHWHEEGAYGDYPLCYPELSETDFSC